MTTTTSTNTNNCGLPPAAEWVLVNPDIVPIDGWQAINDDIGGGHSFLIEYYKRCRSGEIIIGRELKTQLEMLLQDILYRGDIYHFTLAAAHKRIDFIESEIKHFESPFAGKPFILTLCQKAIAEAIFGFEVYDAELLGGGRWVRRYKEVLLLVARKNGKTPFIGALTLAEWFCGEAGQKVMCASNDYEQAGLIFDCINNFREESRAMCKVTRKNVKGIFFGNPRQRKKTGKFSAQNKGVTKMRRKMKTYQKWVESGKMTIGDVRTSCVSFIGGILKCNAYHTIVNILKLYYQLFKEALYGLKGRFATNYQ